MPVAACIAALVAANARPRSAAGTRLPTSVALPHVGQAVAHAADGRGDERHPQRRRQADPRDPDAHDAVAAGHGQRVPRRREPGQQLRAGQRAGSPEREVDAEAGRRGAELVDEAERRRDVVDHRAGDADRVDGQRGPQHPIVEQERPAGTRPHAVDGPRRPAGVHPEAGDGQRDEGARVDEQRTVGADGRREDAADRRADDPAEPLPRGDAGVAPRGLVASRDGRDERARGRTHDGGERRERREQDDDQPRRRRQGQRHRHQRLAGHGQQQHAPGLVAVDEPAGERRQQHGGDQLRREQGGHPAAARASQDEQQGDEGDRVAGGRDADASGQQAQVAAGGGRQLHRPNASDC